MVRGAVPALIDAGMKEVRRQERDVPASGWCQGMGRKIIGSGLDPGAGGLTTKIKSQLTPLRTYLVSAPPKRLPESTEEELTVVPVISCGKTSPDSVTTYMELPEARTYRSSDPSNILGPVNFTLGPIVLSDKISRQNLAVGVYHRKFQRARNEYLA